MHADKQKGDVPNLLEAAFYRVVARGAREDVAVIDAVLRAVSKWDLQLGQIEGKAHRPVAGNGKED